MDISELEKYFESATIPAHPIKLIVYMTVLPDFITSQVTMARAGNKRALARLVLFHDYLEWLKNPPT
jgi:hypothetical protein